ncbi:glycosyltransferase family 2 protein [Streptococcus sp. DD13]|uniref:glycosyltransferase family 2 protein n=1 Tax=Streptococcus sp. DD13 TaxID=1777881 RepID=UPI00079AF1C2|nr:glycosyltransferase family 2 protein [Streptococcus sp. DD13]KXT79336.1 Bactoprenol glucosyl transferase [Streptococcus sp. DD13]
MKLSIVVPCYNEEETIYPFLEAVEKVELGPLKHLEFEYIFVNDGSSDGTLAILRDISQKYQNVHYYSFSRNFGKEAALLAGLEHARGDLVTVMDVDLQDPPELLPQMVEKITEEGFDVVGTRRADREGEPVIRSFFSRMFYKLINYVSDTEMVDGARDFRLMTRQVVDSVLRLEEVNRFSKGLFSWVGFRVTYISFDNRERVAGETSWNFWSLLRYSLEGFINFSEALLNIATYSGLISFLMSILGILLVVFRKLLFDDPVTGWASLVCLILFIGGIQLFTIGILGKYIAKIFLETKKRPIYIIQEEG